MKYLILFIILIPNLLFAEKKWVQKHYIKYEDCTTLECIDSNNCFAFVDGVGKTIIYKSTDQGNSWFKHFEKDHIAIGDSLAWVFRCQVLDSEYVYISYLDRAVLEKSTDGGITFERITFGEISSKKTEKIYGFKMYNREIGVAINWNYLFLTKDNWETYEIIELGKEKGPGEPLFWIDSSNVAMINKRRYDNDFKKFNINTHEFEPYSERVPPEPGEENMTISDVEFINDSVAFASGLQEIGLNSLHYDLVWKTTNRGKNWELIFKDRKDLAYGLSHISFENNTHGMAVGGAGKMLEIFDGGKRFKYHDYPENVKGTMGGVIAWAGQYPIYACQSAGIHRYEEVEPDTDVLEIEDRKVRLRQANDALHFSFDDLTQQYNLNITDIYGKPVHTVEISPGNSYQIVSVNTTDWVNGTYFYLVTANGQLVKSGKVVVVR